MSIEQPKEAGLILKLDEQFPTLIQIGDRVVKVYLHRLQNGKQRARFVSDRDVVITGSSRVKKGFTDNTVLE